MACGVQATRTAAAAAATRTAPLCLPHLVWRVPVAVDLTLHQEHMVLPWGLPQGPEREHRLNGDARELGRIPRFCNDEALDAREAVPVEVSDEHVQSDLQLGGRMRVRGVVHCEAPVVAVHAHV